MSWQLAILVILGLTLFAGMAWYERTRPPSQLVALVAALAALAIAGRVAFSPVPNVVPTTDIAILAGYALGGPPGFAVGALSGLISNFWLGQGPWTPWQMAGWGACGVFGAVLASATGRRLGRIGLAAACGLAGFAFGTLMDLSLIVTYGGEQSLERFLALSARGLPFNLAHAAGNAALALVAGPAIARMLLRYRERFEFAWSAARERPPPDAGRQLARGAGAGLAGLLLAVLLAGVLLAGPAADGASGGGGKAIGWLREAQNDDGGFGPDPGDRSDPAMTGWVALGLESAGINPLDFGSPNPIFHLRRTVDEIRTTGDIERTILVLAGAGLDPRDFSGTDLVSRLRARHARNGSVSGQVNLTAFAILALEAAGADGGTGRSAAWLARARNPDGGWGFAPDTASDPDSTGAAMQALAAADSLAPARRGRGYLGRAQRRNGGFALLGGAVNAQSTAWAVQGLVATGSNPARMRSGGRSPLDYLAGVQAGDGHYRYSSSSDQTPVWVTAQALAAASGQAFPLGVVPRAPDPEPGEGLRAGGQGSGEPAAKGGSGDGESGPGGTEGRSARPPGTSQELTLRAKLRERGGSDRLLQVTAGVFALTLGVWGGWLVYRRRLPYEQGS